MRAFKTRFHTRTLCGFILTSLMALSLSGCEEAVVQPPEEEGPEIVITIPDPQPGPRPDILEDHGYAHFQSLLDYYNAQGDQRAIENAWSLCWHWNLLNTLASPRVYSPEPRGCPVEDPFQ